MRKRIVQPGHSDRPVVSGIAAVAAGNREITNWKRRTAARRDAASVCAEKDLVARISHVRRLLGVPRIGRARWPPCWPAHWPIST